MDEDRKWFLGGRRVLGGIIAKVVEFESVSQGEDLMRKTEAFLREIPEAIAGYSIATENGSVLLRPICVQCEPTHLTATPSSPSQRDV